MELQDFWQSTGSNVAAGIPFSAVLLRAHSALIMLRSCPVMRKLISFPQFSTEAVSSDGREILT